MGARRDRLRADAELADRLRDYRLGEDDEWFHDWNAEIEFLEGVEDRDYLDALIEATRRMEPGFTELWA